MLAADRDHVGALKLRAKLALDADRPEAAVQDMRTALAQAPHDAEALTVMALAYERQGARELAGEQLARAVEASDRAPAESLRYAGFLMQDDRTGPAEAVLVDALRRAPEDPELLGMLGEIHLARRDFARAGQVAALLAASKDPAAQAHGGRLEAARLAGEGRTEETLALLEELAGDGDAGAMAALVRARVEAGDAAGARAWLDGRAGRTIPATRRRGCCSPGSTPPAATRPPPRPATGRSSPTRRTSPPAHRAWAGLLAGTGRGAEAAATLDAGLAANPGDADLMFARAGLAEAAGDREGAIALYEALYARDTGAPVVANNLASLLATTRGDPESPRARLRHRPAAPGLGRAAVPGHLRLDALSCAATRPRRSTTWRRRPRRCPATPRCSSTAPRPSSRSSAATRRGRATTGRWRRPRPAARCPRPRPRAAGSPRSRRCRPRAGAGRSEAETTE